MKNWKLKKMFNILILFAASGFAVPACSQPAPLSPPPLLAIGQDMQGRPLPFGVPPYFSPDTPLGSGPYKAVMSAYDNLPENIAYHPANMDAAGPLPIIVWGNGGCLHAGNRFRGFLTELASHGFLVISAGTMGHVALEVGPQEDPFVARPDGPPRPPAPAPIENDPTAQWRASRSTAAHMLSAIDWAIAENGREGSPFYNKLNIESVGAGGQSCGGSLTFELSDDPRLDAIGIFNSGTWLQSRFAREVSVEQAAAARQNLNKVHTPTIILTGDEVLDIAYWGGVDSFNYLSEVPVFHAWQEGLSHIGTYGAPNGGGIARIAKDWYTWQLKGDQQASRMFIGENCLLCQEPGWHISKKNME